ncbi:NTP transferase domain-containing protein [Spirosoma fluminis]
MTKPNGLILIGGRSSRMGQDKATLHYHGKPQRDYLADLLRPYCERVYWSVNADQAHELAGAEQPCIVDAFDVASPLNGILSAFQQAPERAWLVVPCDMPLLTSQSLDALVAGRNPAKLATVFYDTDGREPEPLLGIYEPQFWPILQAAVAQGEYSPRRLLQRNNVQMLNVPDSRELTNVNDPQTRVRLGL